MEEQEDGGEEGGGLYRTRRGGPAVEDYAPLVDLCSPVRSFEGCAFGFIEDFYDSGRGNARLAWAASGGSGGGGLASSSPGKLRPHVNAGVGVDVGFPPSQAETDSVLLADRGAAAAGGVGGARAAGAQVGAHFQGSTGRGGNGEGTGGAEVAASSGWYGGLPPALVEDHVATSAAMQPGGSSGDTWRQQHSAGGTPGSTVFPRGERAGLGRLNASRFAAQGQGAHDTCPTGGCAAAPGGGSEDSRRESAGAASTSRYSPAVGRFSLKGFGICWSLYGGSDWPELAAPGAATSAHSEGSGVPRTARTSYGGDATLHRQVSHNSSAPRGATGGGGGSVGRSSSARARPKPGSSGQGRVRRGRHLDNFLMLVLEGVEVHFDAFAPGGGSAAREEGHLDAF
eukprot:jgi/Mesen1/7527/ME000391S06769